MRRWIWMAAAALLGITATAQAQFRQAAPAFPYPYMLIGSDAIKNGMLDAPLSLSSLGSLNDNVDSIVLPPGYIMIGYQHAGFRGKARIFFKSGEIEGDLDGEISSVKFLRFADTDCAVAFEHAHYRGEAFPFCLLNGWPVLPAPVDAWQGEISSVQVPHGLQLSFRGDDVDVPARSYRGNSSWIGHASNDTFELAILEYFDDTNFSMIFMSDPQFGWGGTKPNELALNSDVFSNWDEAAVAQAVAMTVRRLFGTRKNHAGVVVNGDVTNTGKNWQIERFEEVFETGFDNIYPGLGNHDYDNYVRWGDNEDVFEWLDKHVSGLPGLISYDLDGTIKRNLSRDAYNGSFAYSWDIGDVHFVQLQNYPSFEVKGDFDVDFDIRKSLDWLEQDLINHGRNKRIVLNMHIFGAAGFNSGGCEAPCDPLQSDLSENKRSTNTSSDFERFKEIVRNARAQAKDNMVLLFAGHIHYWAGAGSDGNYGFYRDPSSPKINQRYPDPSPYLNVSATSSKRVDVPIFYTGGAQWSKHLVVEFDPQGISVNTIDSRRFNEDIVARARVNNSRPSAIVRP